MIPPVDTQNTLNLACFGSECSAQGGSVQCPFLKICLTLLNSVVTFDVCIIVIFFYLSVCQYLVQHVAYLSLFLVYVPASFRVFSLAFGKISVRGRPFMGRVHVCQHKTLFSHFHNSLILFQHQRSLEFEVIVFLLGQVHFKFPLEHLSRPGFF